jgi:hypothetical protein
MAKAIQDLVVLKDGASINGDVKTIQFILKTKYGQLKLKKTEILSVEYKNPPYAAEDEVQVSAGTRLRGDLLPEKIRVGFEDTTQVVVIPKSDILALIFFTGRSRGVSAATRRALKSVV